MRWEGRGKEDVEAVTGSAVEGQEEMGGVTTHLTLLKTRSQQQTHGSGEGWGEGRIERVCTFFACNVFSF